MPCLLQATSSKSQLYHYFTDKDDLVLAVVQRQTERESPPNAPTRICAE